MADNSISFREIVKLIHPDTANGVSDPGAKMAMVKNHRNNPFKLWSLAVEWGLKGPQAGATRPQARTQTRTQERPRPQEPRYVWEPDFNAVPHVNDWICIVTRGFVRVQVIKVTATRVYFDLNGRRSFADKKNVYVTRQRTV